MAWKFVITSKGYLRMGDVKLHRDLLWPDDWCLVVTTAGAAAYVVGQGAIYYGLSQTAAEALMYTVAYGSRLRVPKEYEGFAFVWQEGSGHIQSVNLADWLGIDWVISPHE